MKIAIIGWGALIYNPGSLLISGDWQDGGPTLPIEFSRISGNGRLTLVVDEAHGTSIQTFVAASASATLAEAIENLREREGCSHERSIGFVDLKSDSHRVQAMERHPGAVVTIQSWAKQNAWDAAVWTALPSNFAVKAKLAFSPAAASKYVFALPEEEKVLALDYIEKAPARVRTPVREAVEEQLESNKSA